MDFLTKVYLFYSFVALYFLFLFVLIYFQNRKKINSYPISKKKYGVSIVIPCYNEEKSIGTTIQNLIDNGYEHLKRIVVVDDRSTDNSYKIMKEYEKKYPGLVKAVRTPKNTGNAAGAKNYGVRFVRTELVGFTDADSFPVVGSIGKMVGFFDDLKVGAVTSTVLVHNRKKFIERLQAIEYIVIKFSRKLLEFVDSIYVTPGPLAVYRKEYFDKIGGFDEKNLTEDIEITWNFLANGYLVKMCVPSKVYSIAPSNIKDWFKQRLRWNMGGIQTMFKYRKTFFRKGMLGKFVLPFFIFSWFLGVFGISIIGYRLVRSLILKFFATSYSVQTNAALLTLKDINLTPNVLIFLGVILFVLGLTYTLIAYFSIKESKEFRRPGIIAMTFYMFFYLMAYPIILLVSAYKLMRGKAKW